MPAIYCFSYLPHFNHEEEVAKVIARRGSCKFIFHVIIK